MSELYGASQIQSLDEMANSDRVLELFMLDDLLNNGTSEQLQQFSESTEAQVLMEKQVLNKKVLDRATLMKMDYNRRVKLIAYQMAKENNDPNYVKLVKFSQLKKKYANKVLAKYGTRAERAAKIAQKNYIKKTKAAK